MQLCTIYKVNRAFLHTMILGYLVLQIAGRQVKIPHTGHGIEFEYTAQTARKWGQVMSPVPISDSRLSTLLLQQRHLLYIDKVLRLDAV